MEFLNPINNFSFSSKFFEGYGYEEDVEGNWQIQIETKEMPNHVLFQCYLLYLEQTQIFIKHYLTSLTFSLLKMENFMGLWIK